MWPSDPANATALFEDLVPEQLHASHHRLGRIALDGRFAMAVGSGGSVAPWRAVTLGEGAPPADVAG